MVKKFRYNTFLKKGRISEKKFEKVYRLTDRTAPKDERVRFVGKEFETYHPRTRRTITYQKWMKKKLGWNRLNRKGKYV